MELRIQAAVTKATKLREDAEYLAKMTRGEPQLQEALGGAMPELDQVVEAAWTSLSDDELRRRGITDPAALAELARRGSLCLVA